jgi:hypothetical protein
VPKEHNAAKQKELLGELAELGNFTDFSLPFAVQACSFQNLGTHVLQARNNCFNLLFVARNSRFRQSAGCDIPSKQVIRGLVTIVHLEITVPSTIWQPPASGDSNSNFLDVAIATIEIKMESADHE